MKCSLFYHDIPFRTLPLFHPVDPHLPYRYLLNIRKFSLLFRAGQGKGDLGVLAQSHHRGCGGRQGTGKCPKCCRAGLFFTSSSFSLFAGSNKYPLLFASNYFEQIFIHTLTRNNSFIFKIFSLFAFDIDQC